MNDEYAKPPFKPGLSHWGLMYFSLMIVLSSWIDNKPASVFGCQTSDKPSLESRMAESVAAYMRFSASVGWRKCFE